MKQSASESLAGQLEALVRRGPTVLARASAGYYDLASRPYHHLAPQKGVLQTAGIS